MPRVKSDKQEQIIEIEPVKQVDFVSIQKLALKCEKSLTAVLTWYTENRIIADGFINDLDLQRKPNNAIFTPRNANSIVKEVKEHGKPRIRKIKDQESA